MGYWPIESNYGVVGQLNNTGNTTGNANQGEASRVWNPDERVVNRIGIFVSATAGNLDLAIYAADGGSGLPGTRLASTGSVAAPATGVQLATIAQVTIPAGWFYIAMAASSTGFGCGYWSATNIYDPDANAIAGHGSRALAGAFPLPATWSGGSGSGAPRTLWVDYV